MPYLLKEKYIAVSTDFTGIGPPTTKKLQVEVDKITTSTINGDDINHPSTNTSQQSEVPQNTEPKQE